MRRILVIEQWDSTNKVYVEIASAVLTENDIIYTNITAGVAKTLGLNSEFNFTVDQGVPQADGWNYFKSVALPVPSGFAVVTLPENDEALEPVIDPPGDYEIRAQIRTEI